jgi:protein SCO1
MRASLPLAIVLGVLAGAGSAYVIGSSRGTQPATGVITTGKALIGGSFSLVDHKGKQVTEKDYAGKPMLVFFGFTNCPDICPSGLQIITTALDQLGDKAQNITPLFVTVDPERDTPEKLASYVASFHPRIIGLSGPAENVTAMSKTYRVYAKKIPDDKTPGAYNIDHSSFFYLMDSTGQYVKHFPHSVDANKLATELAALR